ncbi:MAG: metal-dependent hydrolase [Pirellulales bacterium]
MANFQTHVTTSTVLGVGYAGAGIVLNAPIDSALIAGGLCGISGMLPDVDSSSGRPIREIMNFAAAVVPMLMIERMRHLGLTPESMVLAGGIMYLLVRFVFADWLRRYTVHRGMFHSIPAALIFAELGFLVCGCDNLQLRYYKAGAVFLGVMSHLLLDEIYSLQMYRGRLRLKKSFGTALKFWGDSTWANVSTYAKLIAVTAMVLGEPLVMEKLGAPVHHDIYTTANQMLDTVIRR